MNSNYYIYKLNVLDEFYVGSTKDPVKRFASHKKDCKATKYKDKKLYKKMNEIYDLKDSLLLNYEILETIHQTTCKCARQREQYYIDKLKPSLNSINAVLDKEAARLQKIEYQRQKIEKETEAQKKVRLAKKKIWYYKNREVILAKERARARQKRIDNLKDKLKLMTYNIKCLEEQVEANNMDEFKFDLPEIDLDDIEKIVYL